MTLPVLIPLTTPAVLTPAIKLLELCQLPPVMVSVRVIVDPTQTLDEPEMLPANGSEFTVIVLDVEAVPQLLVTEYWITV